MIYMFSFIDLLHDNIMSYQYVYIAYIAYNMLIG